jgi:hypothetical protein
MTNTRTRYVAIFAAGLGLALTACAGGPAPAPPAEPGQIAADDFELPATGPPAHAQGAGPRVGIDEAHGNFHTAGGRYRSFAALLRRDGYPVAAFSAIFDATTLADVDLLVISNAISAARVEEWVLPNPSAFSAAEIAAVEKWVRQGGRLLLIADHMPMPGAAADLARAFGVLFHDGFAYLPDGESAMTFRHDDGSLATHPVTTGTPAHPVDFVTTFTGQAFRLTDDADAVPLMFLPARSYLLLPEVAWEFSDATVRIPADGMVQGALLQHGAGRVAVFGEAAAFSAQVQVRNGERFPMGMNDPSAPHNARFLLNVIAWLTASQ